MKLGVRHRVGIAAGVGVIVAGTLLAAGFWWLFRAQLLQTAREDLMRQAWRIAVSADEGLEFAPEDDRKLVHAAILDSTGQSIESRGLPMEGLSSWPIVREALTERYAWGGPDAGDRIFVAVPVEEEKEWWPPGQAMPAAVVLVASVSERLAAARTLVLYLAGFVPIAALLAALGGAGLAGRALAPVDSMVRAASSIEGSGLSTRLDVPSSSDEIAHLATSLNSMLDRIETAFQHNIRFIADASHELRNPLTNLSSEIQVLLRQDRAPGEYRAALESALEEVRRLSRIADDLLFLARADAGQGNGEADKIDLAEIIRRAAQLLVEPARSAEVTIKVAAGERVMTRGEAGAIERLVRNLLDNAVRYTPRGGRVEISTSISEGKAHIRVDDTGPGIRDAERERVFERFWRGDHGRTSSPEGAGLGLAICREVVEAHKGSLSIGQAEIGGARFEIFLPAS